MLFRILLLLIHKSPRPPQSSSTVPLFRTAYLGPLKGTWVILCHQAVILSASLAQKIKNTQLAKWTVFSTNHSSSASRNLNNMFSFEG